MTGLTRYAFGALFVLFVSPYLGASSDDVGRAIEALDGHAASFKQRFLPRGYKHEQVEVGTVVFGRAPASRWTYSEPEPKTFVFDGTTSWMYVPEDATVVVHEVTREEREQLPFFVLSDPERLREWFELETEGRKTTLTAREASAALRIVVIELDQSGRIRRMEYEDAQQNRTTFDLDDWKASTTTDELFRFEPPPGVEVIHN